MHDRELTEPLVEALAEYLQRHADLAFFELDDDGTILTANDRADELAGRALVGSPVLQLLLEEQRPVFRSLLDRADETWSCLQLALFRDAAGSPSDYEVCARRIGRDLLAVVAQPLRDDLEALNRVLLGLNEELVTTRRELGRERDALAAQNERLLELDRLKELDRIRTGFLITIAHELRTPLSSIYGSVVTLARTDLDLTREQRQPLLSALVEATESLNKLTSEILLATEVEAGDLELELTRADPLALAREVAGTFANPPAGIEISVRTDRAELPALTTDRDRLAHALANLIDNAIRFSPDGGPVDILVTTTPEHVVFCVRDAGIGLPHHEQRRVFDKFYRVDSEQTRGIGGAGLGLYISARLVEGMGGRISASSTDVEGSVFVIELPRSVGASSRL